MLKKHTNRYQISALLISLLLATVFTGGLQKAWADEVTLSGKVTDSEGNPLANARINANRQMLRQFRFGQVAADGAYRIALTPGAYWLELEPPKLSDRTYLKRVADVESKEQNGDKPPLSAGRIAGEILAGLGGDILGVIAGRGVGGLVGEPEDGTLARVLAFWSCGLGRRLTR